MNSNDLGCQILSLLWTIIPCIACCVLLIYGVLCGVGAVRHAAFIGQSDDALRRSWGLWGLQIAANVLAALICQINVVNRIIDSNCSDGTKHLLAWLCMGSIMIPALVLVWRTSADILRRLAR